MTALFSMRPDSLETTMPYNFFYLLTYLNTTLLTKLQKKNVDPRLHTLLDRRKSSLAQSKKRSSNKNAFFQSHTQIISQATYTYKPFLIRHTHFSLSQSLLPPFKKNTEENASPIFCSLSLAS